MGEPALGCCCWCGYKGDDEAPCSGPDGTHCRHWWEGEEASDED